MRAPKFPSAAAPAAAPQGGPAPQAAQSIAGQPQPERRSLQSAEAARDSATTEMAKRQETPEAWLARIAQMRKQGRNREAEDNLAEFRKRYPDYRIPAANAESR